MTTSQDRERVLRKIRACLRLASSSNPNEAAAALRQAQKLMAEHGIDASAAEFDVGCAEASTRQRGSLPPQSIVALAVLIAGGFSCRVIVCRGPGVTIMRFYGSDGAAEVAEYAFTVLRRQLEAAKTRHVRRCRKRVVKEQRAEAFAVGWVAAVQGLFPSAAMSPSLDAACEAAIAADTVRGTLRETTGREVGSKRVAANDRYAGFVAGKSARYSAGVKGGSRLSIGSDLPRGKE